MKQRHEYAIGGEYYGSCQGIYIELHNPYPKNWARFDVALKDGELVAYRAACKLAESMGFTSH